MSKNKYSCPVCNKTFANERAITIHMVYKHKKALNEKGKPVDINIHFEPVENAVNIEEEKPLNTSPSAILPKKRVFSNLNEMLDAQLEVQAKLAEIRLLGQMDITMLMGKNTSPEVDTLKATLEEQKIIGIKNSISELKDLILSLSDDETGEEGGIEKIISEAVMSRISLPKNVNQEVFNPETANKP